MTVKTDCLHFPLDRPCRFHKAEGVHCTGCKYFVSFLASSRGKKHILIVKLGAMGDVLRTTFLLPGLKEKYPESEITWIVAPQSVSVLETNPYLDRIWPFGPKVLSALPLEKFDIVINLDLAPESLALATLAMADKRIGYWLDDKRSIHASNSFAIEWLHMSAFDDMKKANRKTYQYWMSKIVGLLRDDYEIYVPLLDASRAKAAAFSKKHALEGKIVIGINPGAGKRWRLKKWTDSGFIDLIKRLHSRGFKVMLLGGPEEEELLSVYMRKARNAAINAGCDNTIPDFYALLNLCDVVVTGDTMAMHAALGLKKNVVAIFGPTSAPEIELYGRGTKVVTPAPCACCYQPECLVSPDCMEQIPFEAVAAALETYLERRCD